MSTLSPLLRALAVGLVFLGHGLDASAQDLRESEAVAVGTQRLRERRWVDAVAAFAQANKAYPSALRLVDHELTRAVESALTSILSELEKRHATAEECLPYWEFYVENYPFFAVATADDGVRWTEYFRCAAEARLRHEDPGGEDPRFAPCRNLGRARADEIVGLLEGDGAYAHDDFGLCACRAFVALGTSPARPTGSALGSPDEHAWRVYAHRFVDSPFLGMAAWRWSRVDLDPAIVGAPLARRWIWRLKAQVDEYPASDTALHALESISSPWVTPALAMVRTIPDWLFMTVGISIDPRDPMRGEDRVSLQARVDSIAERFPGRIELGLARYLEINAIRGTLRRYAPFPPTRDAFARWRGDAPDDPYLLWADLEELEDRLAGLVPAVYTFDEEKREMKEIEDPTRDRLSDSEVQFVQKVRRGNPCEAVGALALTLLAQDAARKRRGPEALQLWREVLAIDPGSVSRAGPRHAREFRRHAAGALLAYQETRDPAGLPTLIEIADSGSRIDSSGYSCPTCDGMDEEVENRRRAWLTALAGNPASALDRYETLLRGEYFFDSGHETAVEYADLCLRLDQRARLETTLSRLESKSVEGSLAEREGNLRAEVAESVRHALAMLALAESRSLQALEGHLRTELTDLHANHRLLDSVLESKRLRALARLLERHEDVRAAIGSAIRDSDLEVSLVLAWLSGTQEAMRFALEVFETHHGPDRSQWLAFEILKQGQEPALRTVLERVRTRRFENTEWWEKILVANPIACRLRVYREYAKDPDPRMVDFVGRLTMELRSEDPWQAFCLDSE